MNCRTLIPGCLVTLFLWAGCRREESASAPPKAQSSPAETTAAPVPVPAPAEGQAVLEVELLRAPIHAVASAIFESGGAPAEDAGMRERLLAQGATEVVRFSAAGEAGSGLTAKKVETTVEPLLFTYARMWQEQAAAMKTGKEIPAFKEELDVSIHETGYKLEALLEPAEGGIFAGIDFTWGGPPAVREVNTWPVKDRVARIVQGRNWTVKTTLMLPAEKPVLLAAAPEPPDAEGKATGFVLLAFVKAAAGTGPRSERTKDVKTIQAWSFEMPAGAAQQWLSSRRDSPGDEAQCRKLLSEVKPQSGTALIALEMLRGAAGQDDAGSVDSRLAWSETRGFEPADIRYVKFVPVPNDAGYSAVAHRLECGRDEAFLTLPAAGVKWKRWHGSTRGARDEPTGVENSLTGSSEGGFFTGREPGRIFLANAHTSGATVRLTFVRTMAPGSSAARAAPREYLLSIFETPVDPWLPRLSAGGSSSPGPAALLPELLAATAAGTAAVLHTEVFGHGAGGGTREETRPGLSFREYIDPSIHDGKLCFNPGSVSGSVPACRLEAGRDGRVSVTVNSEPVSRHFGFWLPELPDYSAENSGISLSEWSRLSVQNFTLPPPDGDAILSVSLGNSWKTPGRRALHWVMVRHLRTGKSSNADPGAPPAPEPGVSFTLHASDGSVLEHVTVAGAGMVTDGRQIWSLQPREVTEEYHFAETVPDSVAGGGSRMAGPVGIVQTLDGMILEVRDGRWTMTRSVAPARKIKETFTAFVEQPAGADAAPESPLPASCERLVLRQEKLTGVLPPPGTASAQDINGYRKLSILVR